MPYFWLSFCNPSKPKGSQFLGASIVEAPHYMLAAQKAWEEKCNPGGEVVIVEIEPNDLEGHKLLLENMNRLMSMAELEINGLIP